MRYVFFVLLSLVAKNAMAICGNSPMAYDIEPDRDCVSGGFLGVGLGYASGPYKISQGTAEVSSRVVQTGQNFYAFSQNMPKDTSLNGFVGNLNTGYDCRLGASSWSVGFIGGGSFTVIHGKAAAAAAYTTAGNPVNTVYGTTVPIKLTDEGNLDAGLRTGYLFNKRVFCFVHTGWSIHRITFTTPLNSKTVPNWYNCLLVGLGIDVRITPHTVVGIALDAHIGGRSKLFFVQDPGGANSSYISFYARPLIAQGMTVFKYRLPVTPGG